jgi:hypothetical protein
VTHYLNACCISGSDGPCLVRKAWGGSASLSSSLASVILPIKRKLNTPSSSSLAGAGRGAVD